MPGNKTTPVSLNKWSVSWHRLEESVVFKFTNKTASSSNWSHNAHSFCNKNELMQKPPHHSFQALCLILSPPLQSYCKNLHHNHRWKMLMSCTTRCLLSETCISTILTVLYWLTTVKLGEIYVWLLTLSIPSPFYRYWLKSLSIPSPFFWYWLVMAVSSILPLKGTVMAEYQNLPLGM